MAGGAAGGRGGVTGRGAMAARGAFTGGAVGRGPARGGAGVRGPAGGGARGRAPAGGGARGRGQTPAPSVRFICYQPGYSPFPLTFANGNTMSLKHRRGRERESALAPIGNPLLDARHRNIQLRGENLPALRPTLNKVHTTINQPYTAKIPP